MLIELCSIDSTDDFRTEAVTVSIAEEKCLQSQFHPISSPILFPVSIFLYFVPASTPPSVVILNSYIQFLPYLPVLYSYFLFQNLQLMSKMAPMVGKEITERYFLGQFDNLCSDPLFHVRKVTVTFVVLCLNPVFSHLSFNNILYHYVL